MSGKYSIFKFAYYLTTEAKQLPRNTSLQFNNNNNKSNLYSAVQLTVSSQHVHSHNVHTNAICAHMNIHETITFIHIYCKVPCKRPPPLKHKFLRKVGGGRLLGILPFVQSIIQPLKVQVNTKRLEFKQKSYLFQFFKRKAKESW